MAKNNIKSKSGFTIIEVVLVLAIAGLIFLMVFVALPGLQRSRRDTQRREDMGRFMSQLTQYSSNNRGKVPASQDEWNQFSKDYLRRTTGTGANEKDQEEFSDPSTGTYTIVYNSTWTTATAANLGTIYVYAGAYCDGTTVVAESSARRVAALLKLETGGNYCVNN